MRTTPNNKIAKTFPIPINEFGFPDFTNYCPTINGKKLIFKFSITTTDAAGNINMTLKGNKSTNDFQKANLLLQRQGIANLNLPYGVNSTYVNISGKNYTWHHHEDCQSMMLVEQDVHSFRFGGLNHTGGSAVIEHNSQQLITNQPILVYPSPI